MRRILNFVRNRKGSAAAELALAVPLMLVLMFGSLELGNLFLDEHALSKQVRDGARFGARLDISETYDCPSDVFADADADDKIIKVTKDGAVSGSGTPRWTGYWDRACDDGDATVEVDFKCVPKSSVDTADSGNTGLYSTLPGDDIPVVRVTGAVKYRSLFSAIGFDSTNVCLTAESEAAVIGV
jgi:Flp pilus assembly protein TadG